MLFFESKMYIFLLTRISIGCQTPVFSSFLMLLTKAMIMKLQDMWFYLIVMQIVIKKLIFI